MRDRGGQCHGQRVTSRGRGVTRAEGHKQGVIREAARIAGRGAQAEAEGVTRAEGHKQGFVSRGHKQGCMREKRPRSWQRVTCRGRGVTRAEGYKQGVIRKAVRERRSQVRLHVALVLMTAGPRDICLGPCF